MTRKQKIEQLERLKKMRPRPDALIAAAEAHLGLSAPEHKCFENARMITTNGPLGHGWECSKCGRFLQAG